MNKKIKLLNKFLDSKNYNIINEYMKYNIDETIAMLKMSDPDDIATRIIHISIERYMPLYLSISELIDMSHLEVKYTSCFVYEKLVEIYLHNLVEMGNVMDFLQCVVDWIYTISAIDKDYIKSESMLRFLLEFYNNHTVSIGLEYTEEMQVVYMGILNMDLACIIIL